MVTKTLSKNPITLKNKRKGLHSMEYAFLAFVILYILALGKFPNWIQWFRTFGLLVPPGTMVPSFFAVITILLKVTDRVVSGRTELSC